MVGAALGVIIATIIADHMATAVSQTPRLQDGETDDAGMAIPGIPASLATSVDAWGNGATEVMSQADAPIPAPVRM